MILQPKLTRIGFISKLNGFAGEVVLISESVSFQKLSKLKFLFIRIDGIPVPFVIENIFEKAGRIIVKFEGVTDVEYPKRFLNNDVLIESKRASAVKEEFSWKELKGFELIDAEFGSLGRITSIEEYPQQIVATCIVKERELLIPMHEDFIENIDIEKEQIFIKLPEGLVEIYLN